MSSSRLERYSALGAGLWGTVLLVGAFFQPYGDSRCGGVCLHPGFTSAEAPYIVAVGIPVAAIVVGGVGDSIYRALWLRLVLWLGIVALIAEGVLSIASLGVFLFPSIILGAMAALSARLMGDAHHAGADAT